MSHFKMGRKPRTFRPQVPHLSALIAGEALPAPPASVDYLTTMPGSLGMMLNDSLGDCTCAAVYHAIQVWTAHTGTLQTNPDSDVLSIYEKFCGYVPGNPNTDQGGIEQVVLGDWLTQGVPTGCGDNKLAAWVEVDPRNTDDIKRVIDDCGVCYIGFDVPANIMPDNAPPPSVWTYVPNSPIIGGHAVVLAGYNDNVADLISWGGKYSMTWEFFHEYTEEAYALVDKDWVTATGKTPLGMSLDTLTSQMDAMKHSVINP